MKIIMATLIFFLLLALYQEHAEVNACYDRNEQLQDEREDLLYMIDGLREK